LTFFTFSIINDFNHFSIINIELYNTFYFCILDINGGMLFNNKKDNIISTHVQNKDSDADVTSLPIYFGEYTIKIFLLIAD